MAFTTAEVVAILDDARLREVWSGHPAAFAVVGIDRLAGPGATPAATDLDPSLLATALASYGGPAVVLAATAHIDLPYNLARRALSVDHLTRGRSGVLLGSRDPRGRTEKAWSGAGLGRTAELGPDTAADTARAIAGLWQSWPADSVVGDKESGILVRSERIRRVDHRGAAVTAGPLSIPGSLQGTPVLAWYEPDPAAGIRGVEVYDLTVLGGFPDRAAVAAAVSHHREAESGTGANRAGARPVLAEVPAHDPASAAALLAAGAYGILLRTAVGDDPTATAATLLRTAADLVSTPGSAFRADPHTTLRDTLGLPPPADLLTAAAPAFAAPSTGVYR
ncbi:hypothetical protein [Nocardia sp. NPDC003345]